MFRDRHWHYVGTQNRRACSTALLLYLVTPPSLRLVRMYVVDNDVSPLALLLLRPPLFNLAKFNRSSSNRVMGLFSAAPFFFFFFFFWWCVCFPAFPLSSSSSSSSQLRRHLSCR
ncbi:hypothetical protein IWZ03DRAFT_124545 [Phyllosticta citriasiana]|uniref:Uncharacterized protein n=1 Tax=Phyllosticta citriasiana TaxID=595635 RepID=A0ABR1KVF2_9PEZI